MSSRLAFRLVPGCLLAAVLGPVGAQGIYTCVDARGNRLTSDRPITECLDREQKELSSTGTVRRTIGPSLTATERAAQEERERKANEERQRQAEERRAQRALLARYPNQAVHDGERAKALQAVQDVAAAGARRIAELKAQRAQLQQETEFYKDASKWPPKLKRQIEDIEQQTAAQLRFIAAQEDEKKRITARFDEELARLKMLWARLPAAATTGVTPTAGASAPRTGAAKKP
jgi:hypothetical protein